jgi:hypothetical protein
MKDLDITFDHYYVTKIDIRKAEQNKLNFSLFGLNVEPEYHSDTKILEKLNQSEKLCLMLKNKVKNKSSKVSIKWSHINQQPMGGWNFDAELETV